jgi:hypothetical protein
MNRFVAFFAIGLVAFTPAADSQQTACKATAAKYKSLKAGMSYSQVVKIMGCEGEELSSSEMAGFKTVMVAWSGKGNLGANMNAMFQNDELINKAQFGLK